MRIAAIGDIHAAADHLEAALAEARRIGFDQLIIMGDLWTYGPQPVRTLDLVREAIARDDAVLLGGNHDPLYVDGGSAAAAYFAALPDWIAESVVWTREQLAASEPAQLSQWQAEWTHGDLLMSHANPYAPGDWSYLSHPDQFERACEVMAERGFVWGVFGHTHRAGQHRGTSGSTAVTIGSIGQPRGDVAAGQWAMLKHTRQGLAVDHHSVALDWSAHCRMIDATTLSTATKQRLKGFYRR